MSGAPPNPSSKISVRAKPQSCSIVLPLTEMELGRYRYANPPQGDYPDSHFVLQLFIEFLYLTHRRLATCHVMVTHTVNRQTYGFLQTSVEDTTKRLHLKRVY